MASEASNPDLSSATSSPETGGDASAADAALFGRVARGDAAAFAEFYDRHASLWYGLALRIVGSPQEAEDVLQEAAVQLWERAPLYNPIFGKPLSWSVALVRNKAVDRLRASKRKAALHEAAAAEAELDALASPGGLDAAAAGEESARVRAALAVLPGEQREAIELAFFGGLTQIEIAGRLGAPLGTVKARIRRGMLALRDALGEEP